MSPTFPEELGAAFESVKVGVAANPEMTGNTIPNTAAVELNASLLRMIISELQKPKRYTLCIELKESDDGNGH